MNAAGGSFSKVAGLVKLAPNIELTPTFDLSYDHCIVSHPSVVIISLKEIKGSGVELFSVAGFCCRTCGFKFHQKCAQRVPKLCQQVNTNLTISKTIRVCELTPTACQVRMQKILAAAMLAGETGMAESMVGIIMPGSSRLDQVSPVGNDGDSDDIYNEDYNFRTPVVKAEVSALFFFPSKILTRDCCSSAPTVCNVISE